MNSKNSLRLITLATAIAAVATFVAVSPAEAGLDIDFGASISIGDNADLYLAVSSRYFGQDRSTTDRFATRYSDPDDLAVALYLARHSGRSGEDILKLRRRGLTWWDISVRFGLPADIWFVSVDRDPGPPYGKAYGHWKHHKRDRKHTVVLSDVDPDTGYHFRVTVTDVSGNGPVLYILVDEEL